MGAFSVPRALAALALAALFLPPVVHVARGSSPGQDSFHLVGSGYRLYDVSLSSPTAVRFGLDFHANATFAPVVILFQDPAGAWSMISTRFYTAEGWSSLEGPGKAYAGAGEVVVEAPAVSENPNNNPYTTRNLSLPATSGKILLLWGNQDGGSWVNLTWPAATDDVTLVATGPATPFRTSDVNGGVEAGVGRVARAHHGTSSTLAGNATSSPVMFAAYQTDDLVSRGRLTLRADALTRTVDLDRTPHADDDCICGTVADMAAGATSSLSLDLDYAGTALNTQLNGLWAMLPTSATTPAASIQHVVRF